MENSKVKNQTEEGLSLPLLHNEEQMKQEHIGSNDQISKEELDSILLEIKKLKESLTQIEGSGDIDEASATGSLGGGNSRTEIQNQITTLYETIKDSLDDRLETILGSLSESDRQCIEIMFEQDLEQIAEVTALNTLYQQSIQADDCDGDDDASSLNSSMSGMSARPVTMSMDVIKLIKNNMKMVRSIERKIKRATSHEKVLELNIEKNKFNEEIKKIIKGRRTVDNFQSFDEGLPEENGAQARSLQKVKLWSADLKEEPIHEYDSQITITAQMESLRELLTQLESQVQNSEQYTQIRENITRVSAEIMQKWEEIEKIEQSVRSQVSQPLEESQVQLQTSKAEAELKLAQAAEAAQARVTELELSGREAETQLQASREQVSQLTQASEAAQAELTQARAELQAANLEARTQLDGANREKEVIKKEAQDLKDSLAKAQEDARSALQAKEIELKDVQTQLEARIELVRANFEAETQLDSLRRESAKDQARILELEASKAILEERNRELLVDHSSAMNPISNKSHVKCPATVNNKKGSEVYQAMKSSDYINSDHTGDVELAGGDSMETKIHTKTDKWYCNIL